MWICGLENRDVHLNILRDFHCGFNGIEYIKCILGVNEYLCFRKQLQTHIQLMPIV